MRLKCLSLLPILILASCSAVEDTSSYAEHSYEEIASYKINADQVFSISEEEHYIYYYQETCHSCQEIKNIVIDFALNYTPKMYFVEADVNTPTHYTFEEINQTLKSNKIEDVFVGVTPQLAFIKDGKIEKNIIETINIEQELSRNRT